MEEHVSFQVVIFAETRADWLITALACMRINLPVVTVYATLGEAVFFYNLLFSCSFHFCVFEFCWCSQLWCCF